MWTSFEFFDCFSHATFNFVICSRDWKAIRLVCKTWKDWSNCIPLSSKLLAYNVSRENRLFLHSLCCFDVQILIALENYKNLPAREKLLNIALEAKKKKNDEKTTTTTTVGNVQKIVEQVAKIDARNEKLEGMKKRIVKRVLKMAEKKASEGETDIVVSLDKYCKVTKLQLAIDEKENVVDDEYVLFKEALAAAVSQLREDDSLALNAVSNVEERSIRVCLEQ